ncbi:hypothetical protein G6W57_20150 [Streptomyces sp. CAI-121]|uniref:hypothetical protein n=1 Tax=unclassified Streptomyces TaxID=2593676 RepID=UPI0015874146|nr:MULTISPECIES: hypothetical protein [unclassified Streptomyces]NUV69428.1 hypothetical protein [Streptomyces sp. CAI-121]NUW15571.1 hypothetical protein [Streptomyces sp. CAI-68]
MLEAIDAVNWGDLPGPRDLYEPDRVATGLRALATASGLVRAAGAGGAPPRRHRRPARRTGRAAPGALPGADDGKRSGGHVRWIWGRTGAKNVSP